MNDTDRARTMRAHLEQSLDALPPGVRAYLLMLDDQRRQLAARVEALERAAVTDDRDNAQLWERVRKIERRDGQ